MLAKFDGYVPAAKASNQDQQHGNPAELATDWPAVSQSGGGDVRQDTAWGCRMENHAANTDPGPRDSQERAWGMALAPWTRRPGTIVLNCGVPRALQWERTSSSIDKFLLSPSRCRP